MEGGGLGSQTRLSQANHVRGGPLEIPGGRDITQKNLAKEECPKKFLQAVDSQKKNPANQGCSLGKLTFAVTVLLCRKIIYKQVFAE